MIVHPSPLDGACWLEPRTIADTRGSFERGFCADFFSSAGLVTRYVQHNVSDNRKKGTLRGLHFQKDPHWETKVVRCIRGTVFDVVVDLRPESPTFGRWFGHELSAENGHQIYVPKGFAHGFQTLEDDSCLYYLMSEAYDPDLSAGVRYDDPSLAIEWPIKNPILSERDKNLPTLEQL